MAKFRKYKSFYVTLLIIIILLDVMNFISVCATNGSKKPKHSDGDGDTPAKSGDGGGGGTPPAAPPEGGGKGGGGGGGGSDGAPPAAPPGGGGGAPPGGGGGDGPPAPPGGGGDGAPPAPPAGPGGGGDGAPPAPPAGPGGGGDGGDGAPPAGPGGGGGGGAPPAPPAPPAPGAGEGNATVLAYVLFSKNPSTTSVDRPQIKGIITMHQPQNGETVITGQVGALLNRPDGNYKFTVREGSNNGVISYDCTGLVNPMFFGEASLFSFTWNVFRLAGPTSAIGKYFVIEESGGVFASGLIEQEYP